MVSMTPGKHIYRLHGVANAAIDGANLAKAVSYINTYGNVHLMISGNVHVNSNHSITKTCRIECIADGILSLYSGVKLRIGVPPTVGTTPFTATTTRFRTTITSPNLALSEGDIIAIKADDEWPDPYSSHLPGWTHHAMELHRVSASIGSNQYKLAEQYIDNFTINPTIFKVPMLRGVVLENVRYTYVDTVIPAATGASIEFNCCHGLRLINLQGIYPTPNSVWFRYCYGTVIQHPQFDAKYAPMTAPGDGNYGYQIVVGLCTHFELQGGLFGMCRHGLTTTNEITGTNQRWGTSLLGSAKGINFTANRGSTDNFICIDTHAEGYGWVFDDINFKGYDGSTSNGILLQNRARKTTLKNSTYDGQATNSSSGGYGVYNLAPGLTVQTCLFERCTWGIRNGVVLADINADDLYVNNSTFKNTFGPGITGTTGSNYFIDDNTFDNVGYVSGGVAIDLLTDQTPRITRNLMPKVANAFAIRFGATQLAGSSVIGNTMTGYGVTPIDPASPNGAALNTQWCRLDKNTVDPVPLRITDKTASFTLAIDDADSQITMSNTSAAIITVPTDASVAFDVGATIDIFREGAGAVTIAAASGVTVKSRGNLFAMNGQNSAVVLRKLRANVWALAGDRA